MTDINLMRDFVISLYNGPEWRKKVNRMPDDQVMAIYFREKDKPRKKNKQLKPPKENNDDIPF